jgi:glyoxylase-like metal-dependent hydrolase (beta-lactamase superfamily II)
VAITFQAADGIRAIDTVMCGRERVTSAYLVEAAEPALVETGPSTSRDAVIEGLRDLGVGPTDLAHIVVTHIHLDHAGGAGVLAPHFPRAKVWVHERGAPHLAEPSKLLTSAARVYGSEHRLLELFGPVEPLPADRMRSLSDGDRVPLGDRHIEALYTPGHASHHVALADSRTGSVFVGDALGVFLPDVRILRPAIPPPEFDLEQAVASVERIAAREPPLILFSHFGPAKEVPHLCQLAIHRMRKWIAAVEEALQQTEELAEIVRILRARTQSETSPADGERHEALEDRYELASSYEMNAMGLARYIRKRAEARSGGS